jgi:hypothetical protein
MLPDYLKGKTYNMPAKSNIIALCVLAVLLAQALA